MLLAKREPLQAYQTNIKREKIDHRGLRGQRSLPFLFRSPCQIRSPSQKQDQRLTVARAIQQYLQAHRTVGHRPKTLEWHQTVLAHLHQYLQTEYHFVLVHQLTETALREKVMGKDVETRWPDRRGARKMPPASSRPSFFSLSVFMGFWREKTRCMRFSPSRTLSECSEHDSLQMTDGGRFF